MATKPAAKARASGTPPAATCVNLPVSPGVGRILQTRSRKRCARNATPPYRRPPAHEQHRHAAATNGHRASPVPTPATAAPPPTKHDAQSPARTGPNAGTDATRPPSTPRPAPRAHASVLGVLVLTKRPTSRAQNPAEPRSGPHSDSDPKSCERPVAFGEPSDRGDGSPGRDGQQEQPAAGDHRHRGEQPRPGSVPSAHSHRHLPFPARESLIGPPYRLLEESQVGSVDRVVVHVLQRAPGIDSGRMSLLSFTRPRRRRRSR